MNSNLNKFTKYLKDKNHMWKTFNFVTYENFAPFNVDK